jgi:hypothetical protein
LSHRITVSPKLNAPEADLDAIAQTILDYMLGGHEKRAQALHPALAKRAFVPHPRTGNAVLREVTHSELVETVRCVPDQTDKQSAQEQRAQITIYDVFEDIAMVKAVAAAYVDYIHLAKVYGDWQIINVLCRPPYRTASREPVSMGII